MQQTDAPTTFEEILSALEAQVNRLESGEIPLEDAVDAFTRGIALAEQGTAALDAAEKKVELLLAARDGVAQTEPLEPFE